MHDSLNFDKSFRKYESPELSTLDFYTEEAVLNASQGHGHGDDIPTWEDD